MGTRCGLALVGRRIARSVKLTISGGVGRSDERSSSGRPMKADLTEIPVNAPDSVPIVPGDPLDMRLPSPLVRVPGEDPPPIAPLGVLAESLEIVNETPDLGNSTRDRARAIFMAGITKEDADIRVIATALKLRGYSVKTIAKGLVVSEQRIRRVLKQARQDGNLADVLTDLTTEALPLAVEKLIEHLEDGHEWAIRDTLKGLGAFRTHTQQDGAAGPPSNNLEVNFIMPTMPQVMNPRGIVGAPRVVIDAVQIPQATEEVSRDGSAGADQPVNGTRVGSGDGEEAGRLQEFARLSEAARAESQ